MNPTTIGEVSLAFFALPAAHIGEALAFQPGTLYLLCCHDPLELRAFGLFLRASLPGLLLVEPVPGRMSYEALIRLAGWAEQRCATVLLLWPATRSNAYQSPWLRVAGDGRIAGLAETILLLEPADSIPKSRARLLTILDHNRPTRTLRLHCGLEQSRRTGWRMP